MFENEGKWFKGNLHMHTTLSDGRLDPDSARAEYRKAGFDFISITDHWRLSKSIPAEEGGDLYLINGNMLPLKEAGAFANTSNGKEDSDEEVLEVEEQGGNESGQPGDGDGENSVSERHNRRGKLV